MISVEIYSPELKARWDEVVRGSRNGTFLHLRDYMDYHSHRFSDMSLVAFFATGINETPMSNLKLYPNPAKSTIHIAGLEANSSVMIYNSLGELVKVVNANADQEIDVRDLGTGLYMVRCGNATLRFIKEQ